MNDLAVLVRATLALYRDAVVEASRAFARHAWVIVLPPAYSVVLAVVASFASVLGIAGGFVMVLALAACVSSFLTVLEGAVARDRVRPSELAPSFGRHLWSIVNVVFVLWIIEVLLGLITAQNPAMRWLALAVNAGIFVLCNPLPELIYQGSREGLAMIDEAVQFMRENFVEWLLPLVLLLLPVFLIDVRAGILVMAELGPTSVLAVLMQIVERVLPEMGGAGEIVATFVASAALVWMMLFRGFLFRSLAHSGRRQRIFAARSRTG
ncbi:MAG TPA: hypothetical protein VFD92_20940 [Candidatus Binatia bacterium]|nr:hypothetical protein [Candidatus Binatia bacterium]